MTEKLPFKKMAEAIKSGDEASVENFVSESFDLSRTDGDGNTPLHLASIHKKFNITKLILKNSPSIEARDNSGRTALYLAVETGHIGITKLLVDYNADVCAQDTLKKTPCVVAIESEKIELLKYMLPHIRDINQKHSGGETILISATKMNNRETVQLLLENGAFPDEIDNKGKSAPFYAEDKEIRTMLLKKLHREKKEIKKKISFLIIEQKIKSYMGDRAKLIVTAAAVALTLGVSGLLGYFFYKQKQIRETPSADVLKQSQIAVKVFCQKISNCNNTKSKVFIQKCNISGELFFSNFFKMQGDKCDIDKMELCSACLKNRSCSEFKKPGFFERLPTVCTTCDGVCD